MINQVTVCVNALDKRCNALQAAAKFAEQHKATLTATYTKLDTVEIVRWAGSSPMELADQLLVDQDTREQRNKDIFESVLAKYECKSRWRTIFQSENPIRQLLCTDIIFVDQPNQELATYLSDESLVHHLILQSKRPIVMIPTGWDADAIGGKVLVGWNSSAEAMRAVADALPVLGKCEHVLILDVLKDPVFSEEHNTSPELQAYLGSKGILNDVIIEHAPKHNEELDMLLNYATEHNVDLIVIGGYGHSRLREVVMGGMTSHMIKNSTIPVLFSH
ncbi:MAG: universal stress protein [Gammaproteobacteria bacterium]|nr:universal stress protein [Gammaproteobacteria bacterium]